MSDVPQWVRDLAGLAFQLAPWFGAFFFARWWKRRDKTDEEAKQAEDERVRREKEAADAKLDKVLSLVQKLEDQMQDLALRLRDADALGHQVKGAMEKIEQRVDGQGDDHKARLSVLEEKVARLDERTRDLDRPRRR